MLLLLGSMVVEGTVDDGVVGMNVVGTVVEGLFSNGT